MRTHVSEKHPGVLVAREQYAPGLEKGGLYKPSGFWYSVDNGWEDWCADNSPDWIKGRQVYEVELGDENILFIDSDDKLLEFHRNYCTEFPFARFDFRVIDWRNVARDYDGIEIAPYRYRFRLDFPVPWYYGWDYASGCIWLPKGLKLRLLEEAVK